MSVPLLKVDIGENNVSTSLERSFPIVEISQLAEHESWRKEINRPIYHIHKWWATRLGSIFRAIVLSALSPPDTDIWAAFYKRHSLAGKVVLDPFMGSGTTIGEALKLGASAIGCDINPVSTFLVTQALRRVSEQELRSAFHQLERIVAPQINRFYRTVDPASGKAIPVLYFFWVKVVTTPAGESIPLFSRYVFAQDAYPKRKPRAQIVCRHCWNVIIGRYDSAHTTCSRCGESFNPQEGPAQGQFVIDAKGRKHKVKDLLPSDGKPPAHRLYAILAIRPNGEKVYIEARQEDHALYEEAKLRLSNESLPLPTLSVRPGHNTDQARGHNYLHWRDFFNDRQLLCLGLLLKEIMALTQDAIREQLLCLFSSTLEFNNQFCSYKGEGTGAVRHMFSNHILKPERTPLENSVWGTEKGSGTFSSLFESRLIRAKQYLDMPFEVAFQADFIGGKGSPHKVVASHPIDVATIDTWTKREKAKQFALILNGSSATLAVPDATVDAVVTDPPYFDFVHYSELSDFFFSWLSPVLRNTISYFSRTDSSDSGEVQHSDPKTFSRQLSYVFRECHRVLKNDGVLAFSFHHSREEGWAAIVEALVSSGFEVVSSYPVHAEMRGSSPKNAAKAPISLDAILVCKKHSRESGNVFDVDSIKHSTAFFERELVTAGMTLSLADRFVIAASQALICLSGSSVSFEVAVDKLRMLRSI